MTTEDALVRGEITKQLQAWSAGDDRAATTVFSALHATLRGLAERALLVELRFYGGMAHDEIARYLGVSLTTVERPWRLARAWLYRHLKGTLA